MRLMVCAGALLLLLGNIASADILFYSSNIPGGDNVLFNDTTSPTSDVIGGQNYVRGHLQGTPTSYCASGSVCVDVRSNEALLVNNATQGGGGQATIEAVDHAFTLADIFLTNPPAGVYEQIVFALTGVGAGGRVSFSISVTEGDNSTEQADFTTGSGNSFYTVVAISGQDIKNVNLTATDGAFETLKQLRIDADFTPVPEPMSIALFGAVLLGATILRRRMLPRP